MQIPEQKQRQNQDNNESDTGESDSDFQKKIDIRKRNQKCYKFQKRKHIDSVRLERRKEKQFRKASNVFPMSLLA